MTEKKSSGKWVTDFRIIKTEDDWVVGPIFDDMPIFTTDDDILSIAVDLDDSEVHYILPDDEDFISPESDEFSSLNGEKSA